MNRETIESLSIEAEKKYNNLLSIRAIENIDEDIISMSKTEYLFFKVYEVANCWENLENGISQIMSRIMVGLHSTFTNFSLVVSSNGVKTDVLVGIEKKDGSNEILAGLLYGNYPAINIKECNSQENFCNSSYIGFIKGNPSKLEQGSQLDNIINGMREKKWNYIVNARPIPKTDTIAHQKFFLDEYSRLSALKDISFSDTDNTENTSYKKSYLHADKYNEQMEQYIEKYSDATSVGEWEVTIQFGSTNEADAYLLGGMISSSFYGNTSTPEAPHLIMVNKELENQRIGISIHNSIVTNVQNDVIGDFSYPIVSNYLTSNELAIYASFPTMDTAGFAVKNHVNFDVARNKTGNLKFGQIIKNGQVTGNDYSLDCNELNRHCLIVGLTGSGKTNTTKNILHNVYEGTNKSVKIMVIEPAKKEYWELYKLGFNDLQIYTVGSSNPNCTPYCLNPFEKIGNISLQTHIDNVYAAFKASFIMYTPMPYVLERAIYTIYEDYGWDIKTGKNLKGTDLYPTVEDLYWKIPKVVADMGYGSTGKMAGDLIGSMQARINSLRLGSKGNTLNVQKSYPIERILQNNVVIELEDIGDDDVKAFIISLLLIQLTELRQQEEDCQLEVKHLLLIEEAHRLLKNVKSGSGESADPRGAAVEFFCNLLAELRSKGQGFIIADQIPSKLAPDIIKNTNVKIIHRTVDREDRELMGGAMHMTDEQTDYLSSLGMGEAAIYSEGDNRPKLMKPAYAGVYIDESKKNYNREEVLSYTKQNCYTPPIGEEKYFSSLTDSDVICRLCCPYCDNSPDEILSEINIGLMEEKLSIKNVLKGGKIVPADIDGKMEDIFSSTMACDGWSKMKKIRVKACMLKHMIEKWGVSEKDKEKIASAFLENK